MLNAELLDPITNEEYSITITSFPRLFIFNIVNMMQNMIKMCSNMINSIYEVWWQYTKLKTATENTSLR